MKNALVKVTPFSINNTKYKGNKIFFGKNTSQNHFIFPGDEEILEIQFKIQHKHGHYKCKDVKIGSGLYVKIKHKFILISSMLISFCNAQFIIQKEIKGNKGSLRLNFHQGVIKNKEFSFESDSNKIIRIGRSKQNEIIYPDNSVSRVQLTIFWEENEKEWYIYDGDMEKESSNGVWILAKKYVEIQENMVLKIGSTYLKANLFTENLNV